MDAPTLDDIRLRSPLLTAAYPSPSGDAVLGVLVSDSTSIIAMLTGRLIGIVSGTGPFGCPLEAVPDNLVPVLLRAIAVEAEVLSVQFGADARTGAIEQSVEGLAGFTAAVYSENYFSPGAASASATKQIVPDAFLNGLIVDAQTECVREGWLNQLDPTRPFAPASCVVSQDYFPEGALWPYGRPFWFGGPDGF